MDWLVLWFRLQPEMETKSVRRGEFAHLRWRFMEDGGLAMERTSADPGTKAKRPALDAGTKRKLRKTLEWRYEFEEATKRAAKSSVTVLRRAANGESEDEAEAVFPLARRVERTKVSAADTGLAHHKFLQYLDLDKAADLPSLEAEAKLLEQENYLTKDDRVVLDLKTIAAFWSSEIGKEIRAQSKFVRRELPFTAKFSPRELDEILGMKSPELVGEFVVVQGVADLAVILPGEIWVVDFKTDHIQAMELAAKTKFYTPQLKLYARALEKIYSRPVTKSWLYFLAAGKSQTV
jgi:ATP-dependent helicase/nuclease subunit A